MGQVLNLTPDTQVANLIAASPIASVISDPRQPDNPIIACNQACLDLTGYGAEEVLGRNCRFLAGPATEPWLTEVIREGVQNKRSTLVEILNYKKDGTPFIMFWRVLPIKVGKKIIAWVAIQREGAAI